MICLDRRPTDWEGDSVTVDNVHGAFAATAHLTKMGHKTIALITGSQQLDTAAARLEGFRSAIRKAKLEVAPEYIQEGRFDRLSGYEKTRILLQQRPRPTAIVCSNDLVAIGVLSGLREAGLRCPEDISVIGFDDIEVSELTDPALTTIFQPGYQMGAKGAAFVDQADSRRRRAATTHRVTHRIENQTLRSPAEIIRRTWRAVILFEAVPTYLLVTRATYIVMKRSKSTSYCTEIFFAPSPPSQIRAAPTETP